MKAALRYKCIIYLFSLISLSLIEVNNSLKLRGVTLPNWPYVERYEERPGDFKYNGYLIDLIDKISKKSDFEYDLYYSPDGNYGRVDERGIMNGMIGEVYNGRADFALADLTVTDERRRYVEFTEPYMKSVIAAVIHKSNVGDLQTFSDLFYQTDVEYGVISSSATQAYFRQSREPIINKMNLTMSKNPNLFVKSKKSGIERVRNTSYALISESVSLEFAASVYCDLIVLNDTTQEFQDFTRNYAIALKRNSKYLKDFNSVINEMQRNGELNELKNKYWVSQCDDELDVNSSTSFQFELIMLLMVTFIYYVYND